MNQLYLSLAFNPVNVVRERIKCIDLVLMVKAADERTAVCQLRLSERRQRLVQAFHSLGGVQ